MQPTFESSIPSDATERQVSEYRRRDDPGGGGVVWPRRMECVLDGQVVGVRGYEEDGALTIETPLEDGRKHGTEYEWEGGILVAATPYREGKVHGTAYQWDEEGRLLGTYTLTPGPGLDVWRGTREDGSIYISEITHWRDGRLEGFEWWLNEDQRSVHIERHWRGGQLHGIEREWNLRGAIARGWPRYWVDGSRVQKRQYLAAARRDDTLPAWRAEDQTPERILPQRVQELLERPPDES